MLCSQGVSLPVVFVRIWGVVFGGGGGRGGEGLIRAGGVPRRTAGARHHVLCLIASHRRYWGIGGVGGGGFTYQCDRAYGAHQASWTRRRMAPLFFASSQTLCLRCRRVPPPPVGSITTAVHRRRRGGYPPLDPPPHPLLPFQCLRLTPKILLRRLRCQGDLR